jgi:hypothetical protein
VTDPVEEWFVQVGPSLLSSMPIESSPRALLGALLLLVALVDTAALSCASASPVVPADRQLPLGTYGGDGGGMIVGDTAMHLHIGCTFGDVSGRVPVDANGRFDVTGSYMLRAYPITVGPAVPARFTGSIDGDRIVVTATIDDTVGHATVVRGPVSLRLGVEPMLGPCPICRRPVVTLRRHRS